MSVFDEKEIMKVFWIIVAIVCGVYIFIPEPTDAIPILGWLDEATALLILSYALKKLDVRWLDKLLSIFKRKS